MRRVIISLLLIVLITGGGIVLWHFVFSSTGRPLRMPAQVLWVYECPQFNTCWEKITSKQPLSTFSNHIGSFLQTDPPHELLTMWAQNKEHILAQIATLPLTISAHSIDEKSTGLVLYVSLTETQQPLFKKLLAQLSNEKLTVRKYQGTDIYTFRLGTARLSYSFVEGNLMLSRHAQLIEEVLQPQESRTTADESLFSYTPQVNTTYLGQIYLDHQSWQSFTPYTSVFSKIAKSSTLEAHIADSYLSLSGFMTQALASQQIFTQSFGSEVIKPLAYLHLVPNTCAVLKTYTFQDARAWHLGMQNYWADQSTSPLQRRLTLFSKNIDIEPLFNYIGQLAARIYLPATTYFNHVFLLHLQDPLALQETLQEIDAQGSDTSYEKDYKGHKIYYLGLEDLPYLLFGEEFNGFSTLYYTYQGSFLLGSSSLETLEATLDLIDKEKTWHRTLQFHEQLREGSSTANFSLHINVNTQWHALAAALPKTWAPFFTTYAPSLPPTLLSLKLYFEEKPHMHLRLPLPTLEQRQAQADDLASSSLPEDYQIVDQYNFDHPIVGGPKVVYVPKRRTFQIFIEEGGMIHALDKHTQAIWSLAIEGRSIGKWFVLDYYRNQKVQYAFATTKAVYVADETGKLLQGFPLQLPDQQTIAKYNVIDYDGSKRYRFFASDVEGKVYVMDKFGKPLEGWNPKIAEPLTATPLHYRAGQRDVMILFSHNLHMYKRTGKNYPGFPLKLHAPLLGGWIKKRSQFRQNYFVLLSEEGEYIEYTFSGKEQTKELLYPTIEETASYKIVTSVSEKHVIFLVQYQDKLLVLGEDRKKLCEIPDFLQSKTFEVKYYDIKEDHHVLVFFDKEAQKIYFYNLDGQETIPSLQATGPISLVYSTYKKKYDLYIAHNKQYKHLSYNR